MGYFMFASPAYKEIGDLKLKVASYNEALDNAKALENERDKLTQKYNAISVDNLEKIKKLLPDNVDNIRLILEIEKIASPYGMALKDVKYNVFKKESATPDATSTIIQGGVADQSAQADYGAWDLEFSTSGTYNNFLNFSKDLENNLRIVDVASIQFTPSVSTTPIISKLPEVYGFHFKIKTYWLKN